MKTKLKLGTRKSLLAWSQSTWVAKQIERLNPGLKVELYGIETRGDRILDTPLQKVEGKEFFVAEIDQALRLGEVDLTVHSLKDLSLARPGEFVNAAVPRRENPRDVILFGPQVLNRLRAGATLKIGTSSPRRNENIPPFLEKALPQGLSKKSAKPSFEFIEIRGNVHTRLSRVHEPEGSSKALDGVVLAMAGLIRLWNDEEGQKELSRLLEGVRWMVLPLKECPAAPGQGALALECRSDDYQVHEVLKKLHDPKTAEAVTQERNLLSEWGGGCHQRFGATSIEVAGVGPLMYVRGKKPNDQFIDERIWNVPPTPERQTIRAWDGSSIRPESRLKELEMKYGEPALAVFVAHSRALSLFREKNIASSFIQSESQTRVWTSGTASWFRIAELGIWVEGCAEGLGFEGVQSLIKEGVLRLPSWDLWQVLTHQGAEKDWQELGMKVISPYSVQYLLKEEEKMALKQATHAFWSSGSQYNELKEWVSETTHHACGPGKTAARLKQAGLNPLIFPNAGEWKKWLSLHN